MHQVVPYNSAWLMLQSWPESFRNVQPLLTLSQPIHVLYVMSERIRDYFGWGKSTPGLLLTRPFLRISF